MFPKNSLDRFFHPSSIAVIGASSKPEKIGNVLLRNILYGQVKKFNSRNGFKGKVFPVNPHQKEILGLKAYPSVKNIPGNVDVAVIAVPAKNVLEVIKECGEKKIKAAIIISAGFAESGKDGLILQNQIIEYAKRYGVRIVGPNCLGIISCVENLNMTFARVMPPRGPIAFISQSGAFGTAVIEYAMEEYFGISYFVSIGNKSDVDDAELLEYFAEDRETKCISIYMESVKDGRRFYESLRKTTRKTPVVILKGGVTSAGAMAIASHTGALAGRDVAYDAAIKQAGALRARTMFELFDSSRALAYQPPVTAGKGIAIVTNAGGPGVLAADKAYELGLPLAKLSKKTIDAITKVCPPTWSRSNPIDIIGDADPERYRRVLEIVAECEDIGGLIIICSRQALTHLMEIVQDILSLSKKIKIPITVSLVGIVSQEEDKLLDMNGIPVSEVPERAVKSMHALYMRGKFLKRLEENEF